MEYKFDLRRYINAIRKHLLIIGIVTIVSFFIALIVKYKVEDDTYKAFSSVYITYAKQDNGTDSNACTLGTYSDIIISRKVAERAALMIGDDKIEGEDIQKMISYSFSKDSAVYYIYSVSNEPDMSITVANAVANAFVIEVDNITGEDNAQILDEAYESNLKFDGRKAQVSGIVKITFIGFALSILAIIGYSLFSNKTVSVKDATLGGDLEILGVIPDFNVE